MKCPHCQTEFHDNIQELRLNRDVEGFWIVEKQTCPACGRFVLHLLARKALSGGPYVGVHEGCGIQRYLIRPKAALRPLPPKEVPDEFAEDYKEAALVIADSPKASAALSRRCLQLLLREKAGINKHDLSKQIDEVIASKTLPSHLSNDIDAIRNIGNFAAHPIKATSTGEIIPVEQGEAEWNLDVLDGLFDFYFVLPARSKERRAALDAKLASAGKPPVKK